MRPLFTTLLALALAFAFGLGTTACTREEASNEVVPGVRLGMSPRDVRDRFDGGGAGAWQTKVGGGAGASDDTVLEWSASGDKTRATRARFEFHLGMLVAVRAHLREGVPATRVDLTPRTVTVRTPEAGGTDVTILARDCPTHHDEAEALAAKAGHVR
jgi:hypothetical protein